MQVKYPDLGEKCFTLRLNQVSFFGAGFAVAVTAHMIESEEQVMFLVELGGQLHLKLQMIKHHRFYSIFYTNALLQVASYFVVEVWVVLVM